MAFAVKQYADLPDLVSELFKGIAAPDRPSDVGSRR